MEWEGGTDERKTSAGVVRKVLKGGRLLLCRVRLKADICEKDLGETRSPPVKPHGTSGWENIFWCKAVGFRSPVFEFFHSKCSTKASFSMNMIHESPWVLRLLHYAY